MKTKTVFVALTVIAAWGRPDLGDLMQIRFTRVFPAAIAIAMLVAPAAARDVTVLAAASLTDALTAIGEAYKAKTGSTVKFSFAGSSALAKQIEAGAPADIFASASEDWMNYLAERNLIDKESRFSPITNALVLIAPSESKQGNVTISSSLKLAKMLGPDGRLAIADPAHVPAGIYGKEALTHYGLWAQVENWLAITDDVRGAMAFVERAEAPLGIVYKTDGLISKKVKSIATFPEESHTKITYPFALLSGALSEAKIFFAFVKSEDSLRTFERYGFVRN